MDSPDRNIEDLDNDGKDNEAHIYHEGVRDSKQSIDPKANVKIPQEVLIPFYDVNATSQTK
ncbi:hypothetical protein TVAG_238850 [Trichomonas vaginalis G3]|uniref:Uncharacterized protein n=1 Tax=Trichomonas vaginalis (strain ATCC PRA-98 / G3) TaxID=412133 RepID=A2DGB7_TRIV3|nr:hypothetical protein TVAGG3_0966960 [Trichomonas vaginalis G3]EAY20513.1 hypothetical protein TVAG_238850 [Trichomonas vaginalis G3]KAI5488311.1 hypothetical protein TVAGG3_0966960 [Trichomonas vaginalis G3]|eukprot:XP_001581499.1 hypothetical protein [Trichomonas vaginalis G3]